MSADIGPGYPVALLLAEYQDLPLGAVWKRQQQTGDSQGHSPPCLRQL